MDNSSRYCELEFNIFCYALHVNTKELIYLLRPCFVDILISSEDSGTCLYYHLVSGIISYDFGQCGKTYYPI